MISSAMSMFFCYTTVFNAIELFELCDTPKQMHAVEGALGALKILGLNGKNGRTLGAIVRRARTNGLRDCDALLAGLCMESRLPLLTGHPRSYRGIKLLKMVPVRDVSRSPLSKAILRQMG
jgi:predicted nucleic acid-binding protein